MKRTHKYPKTRKARDTSYSQSYKLIDRFGLDHIKEVWTEHGMYRGSYILGTSPYVLRYIAQKNKWKRPATAAPAILEGVKRGNMPASYYKGLDFSGVNTNKNN